MARERGYAVGGLGWRKARRHKPARSYVLRTLMYMVMVSLSVIFMVPLAWMLTTSLKHPGQVFAYPPIWIPNPIMWANYREVLQIAPLVVWLSNTCIITVCSTLGAILSSSLVGFGFARLRFPGRDQLFMLLLGTMMLPGVVTLIPKFILFRSIGWLDTFLPMIVPTYFGGSPYFIFLTRQFYRTIPTDLDDAARIDGASTSTIWLRIMVPLCRPVMTAIAIFAFVSNWNEFMRPLLYLFSEHKKTLAVGLRAFIQPYEQSFHLNMAAAMYMTVPIIALFFFGQRYFLKGVVMTGITGR